jgi:hypothetical protein
MLTNEDIERLGILKKYCHPLVYNFIELSYIAEDKIIDDMENNLHYLNADELQCLIKFLDWMQDQINDAPEFKKKTIAFYFYSLTNAPIKLFLKKYGIGYAFFIVSNCFLKSKDDDNNHSYVAFYEQKGIRIIESGKNICDKTPDDLIDAKKYYKNTRPILF